MNTKAVTSITLTFLSFFLPLAGIFTAIAAIIYANKSKKEIAITQEEGDWLASGNKMIAILVLIIHIALLFMLVFDFNLK